MLADMGVPFPATFTRVPRLRRECFDARFRTAGDCEMLACALNGGNLARIPVIASDMEMGGISSNPGNCALLEKRLCTLFTRVAPKARAFMEASASHLLDSDDKLEYIPE